MSVKKSEKVREFWKYNLNPITGLPTSKSKPGKVNLLPNFTLKNKADNIKK